MPFEPPSDPMQFSDTDTVDLKVISTDKAHNDAVMHDCQPDIAWKEPNILIPIILFTHETHINEKMEIVMSTVTMASIEIVSAETVDSDRNSHGHCHDNVNGDTDNKSDNKSDSDRSDNGNGNSDNKVDTQMVIFIVTATEKLGTMMMTETVTATVM